MTILAASALVGPSPARTSPGRLLSTPQMAFGSPPPPPARNSPGRLLSTPQKAFWSPPPPPKPPASTPATMVVGRDLVGYVGMIGLVAIGPAIDWVNIGGADLVNPARLLYFSAVAVGSVYLGVQRQDIGEASPISGKTAALAPVTTTKKCRHRYQQ